MKLILGGASCLSVFLLGMQVGSFAQSHPARRPVSTRRNTIQIQTSAAKGTVSGTLQLSAGPGGLNAGPFPATLGVTLGIGDTEPITIALDKRLPAGPWNAQITLKSGLLERSAEASITFPDIGASGPVKPLALTTTSKPGWGYPAIVGLAVLLLLLIAAAVVGARRRRAPQRVRTPPSGRETA